MSHTTETFDNAEMKSSEDWVDKLSDECQMFFIDDNKKVRIGNQMFGGNNGENWKGSLPLKKVVQGGHLVQETDRDIIKEVILAEYRDIVEGENEIPMSDPSLEGFLTLLKDVGKTQDEARDILMGWDED